MAYEPLTVEQIKDNLPVLKATADEGRLYDSTRRIRLQQAYDGGENLTDPKNGWIRRYAGESDEDWEQRQTRLRATANPCGLIPRKITSYMTNGTIMITSEDAKAQAAVDEARKRNHWDDALRREVELLTSIYGTVAVAPFWNEQGGYVDYWWANVDSYYPVINGRNVRNLDAMIVSRSPATFAGQYIRYQEAVDVWTPIERAHLVREPKSAAGKVQSVEGLKKLDRSGWMTSDDDFVNPFGCIPFAVFRAQPSANIGTWFALSDIHETIETLEFILALMNNLAEISRKQASAQLVIVGEADKDVIKLGPSTPIVLDSPPQGGSASAEYIYPSVPFDQLVQVIDAIYKYGFEGAGVPIVIVRTTEQPESGVAVKIKMRPIGEITEERRKRHATAEKDLWIYTDMAVEIYGTDGKIHRVFDWEEARDYKHELEDKTEVTHADDYNPTDEQDDLEAIDLGEELGVLNEFEKWQRLHPNSTEEDFWKWQEDKAEMDRRMKEIHGEQGIAGLMPGGGIADTEEDEELDQALSRLGERDGS
jgi:hypothetical protein